jgi:uncharacterized protein (DUF433 family)
MRTARIFEKIVGAAALCDNDQQRRASRWRFSIGPGAPLLRAFSVGLSGAWVFRGTRLPIATVVENLEDLSIEEVMEQFDVTREQIVAVLDFVAKSLRESEHVDAHFV